MKNYLINGGLLLLVAAMLVSAGCGGSGTSSGIGGGGNNLSVTATMPARGGTSVPVSQSITASFSSVMNAATLNTLSFKASSPSGPVAGAVTCVNETAKFKPTNPLPANTLITMVATTAVRSESGGSLGSNYTWSFTTNATVDNTPPTVNSINPSSNAVGVAVNTKVTVFFSEQMDPATLNSSTFKLQGPAGPIAGKITALPNALEFQSTANLPNSTVLTATVASSVRDLSGNAMDSDFVSSFTTGSSTGNIHPKVSSTNPAGGASGVPVNTNLSVVFSESIDPKTVNAQTFTVKGPTGLIAGTVTSVDNVAVFNPSANFANSESFTATVTTGVRDLSGNALAANWSWSFTTAATVDKTPPTVVAVIPAVSSINVPTNQNISITFSKAMDATTLTPTTLTLKQANGNIVPTTITYSAKVVVLNPTNLLIANSVYTASVSTGVADTSGNHLAATKTWTFTTAAVKDSTPPTVLSTKPGNKATNVFLNQSINATFSESMQSPTLNTATFTINGVNGTVAYQSSSHIATFTPSKDLSPNTTYTANIGVGVKDTAGNNLLKTYVWTFTTGIQRAQTTINLGSASTYAVLAGSTVTNAGPTIINGDLGVSPGSAVTGFPPGIINGNLEAGNAVAAKAKTDLVTAELDAAGRLGGATLPGDLSGLTFTPGLYKNSTSVMLSAGNVTLDAQGDANAVFVFQMGSTLTTSPGTQIVLAGGAQAKNIYWSVGSSATIGVNSIFKGVVLAQASITVNTGAVSDGTFLTNIGAVTLQGNTVTNNVRRP